MKWEDFRNQPNNDKWILIDDLTVRDIKDIKKIGRGLNVTLNELMEIVQIVSERFSLSPIDAFTVVKMNGDII